MAMQSKAWMTNFVFKEFLYFFKRLVPGGLSLTNKHFFILDGYRSHVTLEAIEQAQTFGLDMITIRNHISYALKPLDVVYFKLSKTTFFFLNVVMVSTNNYIKLDKVTLANWVVKALDQSLADKNILSRFKVIGIWPLNPITMHEKTSLNNLYTTDNTTTNNR